MVERDVFEVMRTQRAIRRFRPDPVPEGILRQVLAAATWAPSGGNSQPWAFVVVREPELRRQVGELYRQAWFEQYNEGPAQLASAQYRLNSAFYLAEHMGDAPVLVVVCRVDVGYRHTSPQTRFASIYPAAQNLLLAARALGLGTTLTTVHLRREDELKQLLGIPAEIETMAIIPLGYPVGAFGPTTRKPLEDVVHFDRW